jgi:uncharacterized protein with WD repeat
LISKKLFNIYLQEPKTTAENVIRQVAVSLSPKGRAESEKTLKDVRMLNTANESKLGRFSTLDILDKKVKLKEPKRYQSTFDERQAPTDEEKLKRVFDENAMLQRHSDMLCVNKSGVEAELQIRNMFERYRKITGLGRKSRKRGSVRASTNVIFKPSDDAVHRSSKLFKTNNDFGDDGVSVVGSRP